MPATPIPRPQLAFALVACLLAAHATFAQVAGKGENQVISRVYDVSDFLAVVRDHPDNSSIVPPTRIGEARRDPFRGGGGGGGGGIFGGGGGGANDPQGKAKGTPEKTPLDSIIKLIQETVDPTSWRDNGGAIGSIRGISGQLVITQTAENQAAIADLLMQLRETAARMVRIRATWALLGDEELQSITRSAQADQKKHPSPLHEVDMQALAKLQNAVRLRGQTMCFNRQTVHVASGRARTIVTDVKAVVGDSSAAYEPTTEMVQSGATLELTPTLAPDNSTVTLDLTSVVSRWDKPDAPIALPRATATTQTTGGGRGPGVTPESPASIDRLNMPVQSLATTVQLPLDRAVLIGGMTLDPGTDDAKQLYLIIEASAGTVPRQR